MQVVTLNYSISRDHIASIHRVGCKDIDRDQRQHAASIYGPYDGVEAALAAYIDEEMVEMGYDVQDVKIYSCCK